MPDFCQQKQLANLNVFDCLIKLGDAFNLSIYRQENLFFLRWMNQFKVISSLSIHSKDLEALDRHNKSSEKQLVKK